MAFTVRAAEHLSCTETVFPRMRDRVSLLLRQADPLTVFRPPGRRCRMPVGKECLQGAVCREGCSGHFRTASATTHRKERCELLRTNVRHCLPGNAGGSPPPPCGSPLLSRFFGCPGVAARISPRARAFPPRCRTAGPCAFLTEGRSGRSLRNAPRGRDLGRRINRGPHGSEEPQSAAAFRTDRTLCPAGKRYRRDRYETIPRGFRNDRAKLRNKTRAAPNRPGTNPQRFRRNPETFTKSACNASGGKSGSSRGTAAEHRPVKRQNRPVRSPFNYILSKIIVRCE
mgnify:FL=1